MNDVEFYPEVLAELKLIRVALEKLAAPTVVPRTPATPAPATPSPFPFPDAPIPGPYSPALPVPWPTPGWPPPGTVWCGTSCPAKN